MTDFSQQALANDAISRFDQVRRTATLGADLNDAVVFAGCDQHRLAFNNIDASWFLNVDIAS